MPVVTPSPLGEAKEHFGGYPMLDCESHRDLAELAEGASRPCMPVGTAEAEYREAARRTTTLPEQRYLEARASALGRSH